MSKDIKQIKSGRNLKNAEGVLEPVMINHRIKRVLNPDVAKDLRKNSGRRK